MGRASLTLAAALCACLCSACVSAELEPQAVKLVEWSSPQGFDCSKEPWISKAPSAKSSGPYSLVVKAVFDQAAIAKAKKSFSIVSFAGASLDLSSDMSFIASRMPELRDARKPNPSAGCLMTLDPMKQGQETVIEFIWNGGELIVNVDGTQWMKMNSEGTRCWSSLSIGPFPGDLRSVKLEAR